MDDDGSYEELHGPRMLPQHGEGKRVFAQDDLRRFAEREADAQLTLAAAEARRDALQQALRQTNTASLRQQLQEATEEVEELQEVIERRAKRFATGGPVRGVSLPQTLTQQYAAHLREHGIQRQRHASFAPQVTTPQSGSGPDDGLAAVRRGLCGRPRWPPGSNVCEAAKASALATPHAATPVA